MDGELYLEITGADVMGVVNAAVLQGITLRKIQERDAIRISLLVSEKDFQMLKTIANKYGADIRVLRSASFVAFIISAVKRPVLNCTVVLLFVLSFWIPRHILFVHVEGTSTVSKYEILQCAENFGLYFGAKRDRVRSEIVKNGILESVSGLEWAGVNTRGCVAVITVRESDQEQDESKDTSCCDIIAIRDGVVMNITALSGAAAVASGEAVKKDQVLISGQMEVGDVPKFCRAEGEVTALTGRVLRVEIPIEYDADGCKHESRGTYSIILGKNRINLSKGSGISCTGCDKISKEYSLTLPGGFSLPVTVAVEHFVPTTDSSGCLDPATSLEVGLAFLDSYLLGQMVSGRIVDRQYVVSNENDVMGASVVYACTEMIGRPRLIEPEVIYGKND